jgi:hypothetical protein
LVTDLRTSSSGSRRRRSGSQAGQTRVVDDSTLFINDSDHSAKYEGEEYQVVAPKLSERAIVLGDNVHLTAKLARFSRVSGRSFIMFYERPKDH